MKDAKDGKPKRETSIDDLNDDILQGTLFLLIGEFSHTFVGRVNKKWKHLCSEVFHDRVTSFNEVATMVGGDEICCNAAWAGHLDIVKLGGYQCWDHKTWYAAAENSHMHILEWGYAHGIPLHDEAVCGAASGGHVDVLRWCQARECRLLTPLFDHAASRGHIHVLAWARSQGLDWDSRTDIIEAIDSDQVETLQWLRRNRCSWDWFKFRSHASMVGSSKILDWLNKNPPDKYRL